MDPVYTLIVVNLIAGFGFAIPLLGLLGKGYKNPIRNFRCFAILIGIYFIESVAIAMGMGIPVFSVGLAFAWGIVFGSWLRRTHISTRGILKGSFLLSLYSSLPAVSFVIIPLSCWINGWNVLSVVEGARFGIPEFPWPLGTILGFYGFCAIGAVVLKTVITTGEVSLLIHLREKSAVNSS